MVERNTLPGETMTCQHSPDCHQPVVDGSAFCQRHSNEPDRVRGYRLNNKALRDRFERHCMSSMAEALLQDIALVRSLIEDQVAEAHDPAAKMVAARFAAPNLLKLASASETLRKLQRESNDLMSREQLLVVVQQIAVSLNEALGDEPCRDRVVDAVEAKVLAILESMEQE